MCRFVLSMISVALVAQAALGQCGPGGCLLPDRLEAAPPLRWVFSSDVEDQERVYLYRGDQQIGGWDYAEQYYRSYSALTNTWGAKQAQAPSAPPAKEVTQKPLPDWQINGVIAAKLEGVQHECYSLSGRCVPKKVALQAVTLEDDSDKLWLLLNGSEASRTKVLSDLESNPQCSDFRKRLRIWSVPADHFSLLDRYTNKPMFENTGNPSIYLLAANGKVLYQQNGYQGAADLEDLRKSDPNFTPPKKEEPKKSEPKKSDTPAQPAGAVPVTVILAAGALTTLLLLKGRKP